MHNGKNAHFENGTEVILTHRLNYQQILVLAECKQMRYHTVPQMEKLNKLLLSQMEMLTYTIHEKYKIAMVAGH
jgi:hypothetical protein